MFYYSMSTVTLDELRRSLVERRRLEEAFKQNVINRITAILQGLRDCPAPPPGSPAAAALDLTRTQLDAFINELTHPDNLTDAEASRIANTVNRDDLRRIGGPTRALPRVGPPGSAPTPSSWSLFGKPSAPAPVISPLRRSSVYSDGLDEFDESESGTPAWAREPRVPPSRPSTTPDWLRDPRVPPRPSTTPDWLRDPRIPPRPSTSPSWYGPAEPEWVRGPRRGGWKSPRKRKPRGTKKYHNKV